MYAECGLGHVEPLRGTGEVALLHNGMKIAEMMVIELISLIYKKNDLFRILCIDRF